MKPGQLAITAVLSLFATSPAAAEMPGASCCGGSGCVSPLTVGQPGVTTSFHSLSLKGESCFAWQGAVVLLRDPAHDAYNPSNWTDVAVFYESGAPWQGGYATDVGIVSEENPAGGTGGIQDADLFNEATIAKILAMPNTVYLAKDPSSITAYDAVTPTWTTHFFLRSDPGLPVSSLSSTLGRLKAIYR